MNLMSLKKVGVAAILPLTLAQFCAWFLAPATAIVWLLINGAWSAAGFCVLSSLFVGFLAFLTLFFGGFLGPLGMLFLPLAVAAYAQYDFLFFARRSQWTDYQVQFAIFSLFIAVIPTIYLGKGEENSPAVMSMQGLFAIIAAATAWLYYHGHLDAYWHFALIYLTGSILGFFVSAGIAKLAES
jgi:hypothetical protein